MRGHWAHVQPFVQLLAGIFTDKNKCADLVVALDGQSGETRRSLVVDLEVVVNDDDDDLLLEISLRVGGRRVHREQEEGPDE